MNTVLVTLTAREQTTPAARPASNLAHSLAARSIGQVQISTVHTAIAVVTTWPSGRHRLVAVVDTTGRRVQYSIKAYADTASPTPLVSATTASLRLATAIAVLCSQVQPVALLAAATRHAERFPGATGRPLGIPAIVEAFDRFYTGGFLRFVFNNADEWGGESPLTPTARWEHVRFIQAGRDRLLGVATLEKVLSAIAA